MLCLCRISNIFTCLVESKPVKQDVSDTSPNEVSEYSMATGMFLNGQSSSSFSFCLCFFFMQSIVNTYHLEKLLMSGFKLRTYEIIGQPL